MRWERNEGRSQRNWRYIGPPHLSQPTWLESRKKENKPTNLWWMEGFHAKRFRPSYLPATHLGTRCRCILGAVHILHQPKLGVPGPPLPPMGHWGQTTLRTRRWGQRHSGQATLRTDNVEDRRRWGQATLRTGDLEDKFIPQYISQPWARRAHRNPPTYIYSQMLAAYIQ